MESAKNITLVALAVLAAALILPISHASAQDDAWRTWAPEQEVSGVRLHIDNDLFAVRNLDRFPFFDTVKKILNRNPSTTEDGVPLILLGLVRSNSFSFCTLLHLTVYRKFIT